MSGCCHCAASCGAEAEAEDTTAAPTPKPTAAADADDDDVAETTVKPVVEADSGAAFLAVAMLFVNA
jgi:hypothetical protein